MPNTESERTQPCCSGPFRAGRRLGSAISVSPGPPLVVAICGEVDIQSAPGLREELLRVIRRHGPQLIIDLSGVTFLDCAGLNVLVATRRRAQLEDGWVRLVRVPPQARRMISLLKLDWAFGLGSLESVA
jgi:anti-sigma B factor antagonist